MKMKQTKTANEKVDPLMRIQEEIKEVKRREREYRQLKLGDYDEDEADANSGADPNHVVNNNNNNNNNNSNNNKNELLSLSPEPSSGIQMESSATFLSAADDRHDSLASSVNSKESLEEHNSDDSGISASSSPINGSSANGRKSTSAAVAAKEQRYVGPNSYNSLAPIPPTQKLLTRTVSTPQIFIQNRIIAQTPSQKGLMQRFIASRGKLMLNNNNNGAGGHGGNPYYNDNNKLLTSAQNTSAIINNGFIQDFGLRNTASIVIPTVTMTPTVIERDADGKPIRRGYVPVEVKIQRELKDYKSRESELKKYRKIRDSTPDLLESIDMEIIESDADDDEEHCYGPGKMRSAKSFGELCESVNSNSLSPRTTPSPDYDEKLNYSRSNGMRPAVSLAQLCDLDPQEAPSSHRLIAQWESIIKKNEQKCERK